MRVKHPELQRVTWDQAAILGFASSNGFGELKIEPAKIRRWASDGGLRPVAVGPRGNVLYQIGAVIACAKESETRRPVTDDRHSPIGPVQ